MATLLVIYKTPKDAAAFDKYYAETHIPLVRKIPGLKRYEISRGAVTSPAGATGVHLIAILSFDSMAALESGRASPEGQAAATDVQKFATGGADVMIFDHAPA